MSQLGKLDRVCVLSAHLPSSLSGEAGQRLAFEHLRQISQFAPVRLIAMANARERESIDPELSRLCENVTVVPVTAVTRLLGVVSQPALPAYVALRASRSVGVWVERQRQSRARIVFWAEYLQMAQYASGRPTGERWVVVCHDVLSQFFERRYARKMRFVQTFVRWEVKRLRRWERGATADLDGVLAFSHKDADLLQVAGDKVVVAYPRVQRFLVASTSLDREAPTVLFWGAMNRFENEDAVTWFVNDILPQIRAVMPAARLLVVGGAPSARLSALCARVRGVTVTGYVSDPLPYFAKAWFSIAPLRSGAGVKIKVLESLGSGRAVVATSVGAEGIDAARENGLLIADSVESFARECLELLSSPTRCISAGENARDWFDRTYTPGVLSDALLRALLTGRGHS